MSEKKRPLFRFFMIGLFFAAIIFVSVMGLRGMKFSNPPIQIIPDMDDQPRVDAQERSKFFADGRASRTPVAGTVSTGAFNESEYFSTGKMGEVWGDGIPVKIDREKMERGRERFNINCAICHGPTGSGNGIVTEYGLVGVANFHTDKFRQMSDGEMFNTITHGKGLMNGYGAQIRPEDRWAIIAYLRALQRAQNASLEDVPEDKRGSLNPYE